MIDYLVNHGDKLATALIEHLEILIITLVVSIIIAGLFTIIAQYSKVFSKVVVQIFSVVYSVPSLALFALLIPISGLGMKTAIIVLVAYNQYLLLGNFLAGLGEVDGAIVEAATGLGMTKMQVLVNVKLPLGKRPIFTGIRLAVVSTIGIATIGAAINAGGLGTILFDGLRTINAYKILWGTILSAGLAIGANGILSSIERRM